MPFVKPDRRLLLNAGKIRSADLEPGDRCYLYYKKMVEAWRAEPRWTTAHTIYKSNFMAVSRDEFSLDNYTARYLAWLVFFQLHVMPYELKKREENGDI